jgi:hypothetical protein
MTIFGTIESIRTDAHSTTVEAWVSINGDKKIAVLPMPRTDGLLVGQTVEITVEGVLEIA